jgi:acetyltransferase
LLRALGIPTMPGLACADRAEAHRAFLELGGGAVAVKLLDASVLHKTELGGVRLGVTTAAELDEALDALEAVGARRFLVESMAPPGADLVLGARRDPVFGPVVLLGLVGTAAEALDDVSLRLAPLSPADAAAMPDGLAGRRLLDGWRGGPRLDRAALAELVVALGGFLAASPALAEVEINPLRVTADGLVALDAVCLAADPEAAERLRAELDAGAVAAERPVAEPAADPVAVPAAGPVAVPAAGPVAVPAADPVAEPVVGPAAGPVAVPAAGPVAEPVVGPEAERPDGPAAGRPSGAEEPDGGRAQ